MDLTQMRCWAEVSLPALENNYRVLRALTPAGCRFAGIVKANAYGHGAVETARKLKELGAEYLAVACLSEAVELRDNGLEGPILILGPTPPELTPLQLELELTQCVTRAETSRAYSGIAESLGKTLKCHLKIDSGMGRLGLRLRELDFSSFAGLPGLEFEGLFTHFSSADEPECGYTELQLGEFLEACRKLEAALGFEFKIKHCAASSGVINYPQSHFDMVRPGIALYGCNPCPDSPLKLLPVMRLKCRVIEIKDVKTGEYIGYGRTWRAEKDCRIAVLSAGYGDGLHRVLSNRARVFINGAYAPLRGRICMDMCMADITELKDVKTGDIAELFGENLPLEEQAELAGTITYELLCALTPRVPRVYIRGGSGTPGF